MVWTGDITKLVGGRGQEIQTELPDIILTTLLGAARTEN
jgi:hypothetical protein